MEPTKASHFRLEWIASFVAVARHGSFSAAAAALYRSQPRVSSHIADFERTLGVKLLDRSLQPVRLTPEGRALLPHAEAIMRRLAILDEFSPDDDGAVHGEVRIGMYPSAAAYLFPPVVQRLRERHSQVTTLLREGPTLALEAMLASGEIDLAVRPLMPLASDRRLASTILWREPLVAVLPERHVLASARTVRLANLAKLDLVTIGETGGARQREFETDYAFAYAGLIPHIMFQTNQPQTLVSIVRSGLGVGVTNGLAMTTANLHGLRLVPVRDASCQRVVALFWRGDHPASAAVAAVLRVVTSAPAPTWPWAGEDEPTMRLLNAPRN